MQGWSNAQTQFGEGRIGRQKHRDCLVSNCQSSCLLVPPKKPTMRKQCIYHRITRRTIWSIWLGWGQEAGYSAIHEKMSCAEGKIKAPSLLHKASEIVYMFTNKIGDVGRIFLPFKFLPLLTATTQIHYAHLRSPCPGHSIWHQLQCLKGMT